MNQKYITIDGQEYEFVPQEARVMTTYLFELFDKLQLRSDIQVDEVNEPTWKFIEQVFVSWKAGFPLEYDEWIDDLKYELEYERPIQEAVKSGGYNLGSYPMRPYQLLKVFFPSLKLHDRDFIKKLIRRIPEIKHTNYKI